jgi:hypothetical protein
LRAELATLKSRCSANFESARVWNFENDTP